MDRRAVNLRATRLRNFWGERFDTNMYLWRGSARDMSISEMENLLFTNENFATKEEIQTAYEYCKGIYYQVLPLLSEKLNIVHNSNYSQRFWQISFGLWLFRHICNVYDKFKTLNYIDIQNTDFKVLSKESYYTPNDHYDYLMCFAKDFGVEQLISQFFLARSSEVKQVELSYLPEEIEQLPRSSLWSEVTYHIKCTLRNVWRRLCKKNPSVALLGVYFTKEVLKDLSWTSKGSIETIIIPQFNPAIGKSDLESRKFVAELSVESEFEQYFCETLIYCLPKIYVEGFNKYISSLSADLSTRRFKYIISEDWIGNTESAIYVANAVEKGRKFVSREHGFGSYLYKNDYNFISSDVADYILTTGWKSDNPKVAQGGFANRPSNNYKFEPSKESILYVSRTVFLYEAEIIDRNIASPHFFSDINNIAIFLDSISATLRDRVIFRPRKWNSLCWDTLELLGKKLSSVRVDDTDFSSTILANRLIVIDHISTALAEIISVGAPFILICDYENVNFIEEFENLIPELIESDLLHSNSYSASNFIIENYANIYEWWRSDKVTIALNNLKKLAITGPKKNSEFLLGLDIA